MDDNEKKTFMHDLNHVVQQKIGRVEPTTEVGGVPDRGTSSLEDEADRMGEEAKG